MINLKILLLSLILNAQTGEPVEGPSVVAPFDTVDLCEKARAHVTLPKVDKKSGKALTVVVYTCAAPPGFPLPAAPVEPINIDEDSTRATL